MMDWSGYGVRGKGGDHCQVIKPAGANPSLIEHVGLDREEGGGDPCPVIKPVGANTSMGVVVGVEEVEE